MAWDENTPTITYQGGAIFVRSCPTCRRFVKADDSVTANGFGEVQFKLPNATCTVHGRVAMPFLGYYE
jgi:hypothetical protein